MTTLKRYRLFIAVLVITFLLTLKDISLGYQTFRVSGQYLLDMLTILPPIFILIGLLDVWVPKKIVEDNVGDQSGIKGILISIFVGSAAAGPLYAAFPVAEAMLRKGGSLANVVIFLGTWAAIKIPMIMMEVKYLGWTFSLTRLALTLPVIILSGFMMQNLLKSKGDANSTRKVDS